MTTTFQSCDLLSDDVILYVLFFTDVDVFCGLKNQLYTSVKVGDSTTLDNLLTELTQLTINQNIPKGNVLKLVY